MDVKRLIMVVLLFSGFAGFSQQLVEDKINVGSGTGSPDYRNAIIYLPVNYSKDKAYPLVLFAHGMGQAGTNIKKLYEQGLPKVLKEGYRPPFDFIMVAVQRNSFSIAPEWVSGILNDCQNRWKIDASRIYLTGLSAGGWPVYGSQLNFSPGFAKKFAAIVINSGASQNVKTKNMDWWKQTKTPVWAIVGAADKGFLGQNKHMVKEINKRVPGLATLTVRPGVGHGGWSDIYNGKVKLDGKNMWEWLYQYKRDGSDKPGSPGGGDSSGSAKSINVNLYGGDNPMTTSSWNNWNVSAGTQSTATVKYNDGSSGSVTVTLSSSQGIMDNGTNYGSGMAPAGVLRYTSASIKKRTLTIAGLATSKTYSIHLYASRRNRQGYTTIYKINKKNQTISTNNNLTDDADFDGLKPDRDGQIQITIDTKKGYNYLNGFAIIENKASSGK